VIQPVIQPWVPAPERLPPNLVVTDSNLGDGCDGQRLRLLTFNIQAGTSTARYHQYVTHSWRQVFPHSQRIDNLDAVASLIEGYDMVALQEADSGSLRSGFINQSRYLATQARMPFWCHQPNRKVGNIAYAGNGFLSRFEPQAVEEFRLPGAIPGRGSLVAFYGSGSNMLAMAVVHLALGRRARGQQLKFLTDAFKDVPNLVVMGDMNTPADSKEIIEFSNSLDLKAPTMGLATYPSWQPQRAIDHILVSAHLHTRSAAVLAVPHSDHCPVELTLSLPAGVRLVQATRPVVSIDV
jgi:endonuclease/exonuclease/phosphatase family metal-dependent hydrolase